MQASEVPRAVAAAMSTASSLDLTVDDAIVLHDSNRLTLRLLPCDVLARVAPVALQDLQFEVELAQRLAESGCPVATLERRVDPCVYERDGFVVTLWTYYEPATPREVSPADYANPLERLHAGMRKLDVTTPHFTDRVEEAQQLVASRDHTPALADADRELLGDTLRGLRRVIGDRGVAEQLLHGEPHPGNVLVETGDRATLVDFGIASMTERLTLTGMISEAVRYYAPEQRQGKDVSPASEVYACGRMMYEMLAGRLPVNDDTPIPVMLQRIEGEPRPLVELRLDIPPDLERLIMRCLEKQPEKRFRDGSDLARALEQV